MRRNPSLIVAGISVTACFIACKPNVVHKITSAAYIIGPDNMRPMNSHAPADPTAPPPDADLVKKVASTAVLLVTPLSTGETRFCSGNIYNSGNGHVVLTNRHCFVPEKEHSANAKGADPWACEKTQVYREFDLETALPSIRNGCVKDSLVVNALLDLAVFKLADSSGQVVAADALPRGLELRKTDPLPADRVGAVIVHFPDIQGQRVRMDLGKFPGAPKTAPRMTITWEDCKTAGYFRAETFSVDPSLPYSIRHTCDMIKGSSGSSLVDVATGESLGVNWGGIKFGDAADSEAFNISTRATMVGSFLSLAGPELESLLLTIAEKPPEGTVGNGEADATTKRAGGSRHLTVAGCAKMEGHERLHGKNHANQGIDLGWVVLGLVLVAVATVRQSAQPAGDRVRVREDRDLTS